MHWSLPSDECHDYNTGAWLEVTDTHDGSSLTSQFIPEDCQTRNESSLSITVQTKNNASDSISQNQQPPCQIIIPRELEECKVYSVQIVPEYDSVRGQLQSTDVIIPPKVRFEFMIYTYADFNRYGDMMRHADGGERIAIRVILYI